MNLLYYFHFQKGINKKNAKLNCFPSLMVFGVTLLVWNSQVHALHVNRLILYKLFNRQIL